MTLSWKRIDRLRTVGEATLLKHALEAEGIEVQLRGEHRAGLVGELPTMEAGVEVLVPEDAVEAANAVAHRLASPLSLAPWPCAACGEENPGTFELCWKCGVEKA